MIFLFKLTCPALYRGALVYLERTDSVHGKHGMHGKPVPKPVVGALTKEPGLVFPLTMVDLIAQEITMKACTKNCIGKELIYL